MANNWPLQAADLRKALQIGPADDDTVELELFMSAACELIDRRTGRDIDLTRWEVAEAVPTIFLISARETAKLWWQQTKNGPRNRPPQGEDPGGPPAGADLPRKVQSWLASFPPRLYREEET